MDWFSKNEGPVFLKSHTSAETQVEEMRKLVRFADSDTQEQINRDIKLFEAGIFGEKSVSFELENSHLPLYVLQDLCLEHDGLTGQIDFLVIAPRVNIVIECKNLFGNIEVNSKGDFMRVFGSGKHRRKEGLYSPITQNERHLQLMKDIRSADKSIITRTAYERWFSDGNKSVVVLANPKTILNDRFAKKSVKEQIIRADALIAHIKALNEAGKSNGKRNDKAMRETAEYWLSKHVEQTVDIASRYGVIVASETIAMPQSVTDIPLTPACPTCGAPMILRTAKRGERTGKQFWGCSNYPRCRAIVNLIE